MRELQDQLEAEQYFSVSIFLSFPNVSVLCHLVQKPLAKLYVCPPSDTLQNSGQGTEGGD